MGNIRTVKHFRRLLSGSNQETLVTKQYSNRRNIGNKGNHGQVNNQTGHKCTLALMLCVIFVRF
jgi:hypothetical protein